MTKAKKKIERRGRDHNDGVNMIEAEVGNGTIGARGWLSTGRDIFDVLRRTWTLAGVCRR